MLGPVRLSLYETLVVSESLSLPMIVCSGSIEATRSGLEYRCSR